MAQALNHKEIIESCKAGNRNAQFELYKLYSKAMYNICLRMLKDDAEAEDMLQDSFVDAFKNLERFRYQASFGSWLKRIVINNCINHLKKRRLQFTEMKDHYVDIKEEHLEEEPSNLSVDRVKQAILQLPDGYRVVLTMYLLEGYDHTEIAQILEISESTSKSQYSRAKKKLKSVLVENVI